MLSFILEEIMKKLSLILIASTFATVHAAPITLKSPQKDQLGYSYGYLMGKGNAETLKDLNIETFVQGVQEAVQGKVASLTDEDMAKVLNQYKKRLVAKQLIEFQEVGHKNELAGKTFLAENAGENLRRYHHRSTLQGGRRGLQFRYHRLFQQRARWLSGECRRRRMVQSRGGYQ